MGEGHRTELTANDRQVKTQPTAPFSKHPGSGLPKGRAGLGQGRPQYTRWSYLYISAWV